MAITRQSEGWHTYTLRKKHPAGPRTAMLLVTEALVYPGVWLMRMAGTPWRRLAVLFRGQWGS